MFFNDVMDYIFLVIVILVGLVCCFLFCNECFTLLPKKWIEYIYKKIVWKFRIVDMISFIISATINLLYFIFEKPWFLNDIISICITGIFLKILKFSSMKVASIFLLIIAISECVEAAVVHFIKNDSESYDSYII